MSRRYLCRMTSQPLQVYLQTFCVYVLDSDNASCWIYAVILGTFGVNNVYALLAQITSGS